MVEALSRNIRPDIISKVSGNLLKLSTKHDVLNQLHTRNSFNVCKEALISVIEVPVSVIFLRECPRKISSLDGQKLKYYNCISNFISNCCKCKKKIQDPL